MNKVTPSENLETANKKLIMSIFCESDTLSLEFLYVSSLLQYVTLRLSISECPTGGRCEMLPDRPAVWDESSTGILQP